LWKARRRKLDLLAKDEPDLHYTGSRAWAYRPVRATNADRGILFPPFNDPFELSALVLADAALCDLTLWVSKACLDFGLREIGNRRAKSPRLSYLPVGIAIRLLGDLDGARVDRASHKIKRFPPLVHERTIQHLTPLRLSFAVNSFSNAIEAGFCI
jgi:hypothetical protein